MSSPVILTVKGRRVRARIEGDRQKPPVLLLHGIGRSLEDWAEQFVRLSGSYRLIALDLPGSGFSERLPEATSLPVLASAVLETLDAVSETRAVHVVGNSLGGAVAMQIAAARPDRVASLVLVDSAGFGSEVILPLRLMTLPGLGGLLTKHPTAASARMLERMSLADPSLITAARVEHALAIARQPDTAAVMVETARSLATIRGVKEKWRSELLNNVAALRLPTLVVWGDHDRVLPSSHLRTARKAFPHAEVRLFPDVNHMPQIEIPDQFAERVSHFLDGVADRDVPVSGAPQTLEVSHPGFDAYPVI
ncbi:alpha/beta fold hydrolase [Nocardia rhizosphaerihabitans]|uniref:Alpha/beta hydrolase n=1 Tax=Nocardia rhizosphaerihabitans TaxID=1691570 RepID=A0ABQ2L2S7_9NOCA|nr:alpha/beta fold hydrolase [Nocardia rhizosphaerihabitans]GGO00095.1 alpha/beta hydrolase [Nocardia rhizosphaerihabitans]